MQVCFSKRFSMFLHYLNIVQSQNSAYGDLCAFNCDYVRDSSFLRLCVVTIKKALLLRNNHFLKVCFQIFIPISLKLLNSSCISNISENFTEYKKQSLVLFQVFYYPFLTVCMF